MEKVQVAIVGAGVVGLAVAAELTKKFQDIVVLEKELSFGQGSSSRNSEVIHAGLYYPKDSLKARLCAEGNKLLYRFCELHSVPYARLGKLIVAQDEREAGELVGLEEKAIANGVTDLKWLSGAEANKLEPSLNVAGALFSPSTGIVDSHQLMKQLELIARNKEVMFAYGNEVTAIKKVEAGHQLTTDKGEIIEAKYVVNSGGLFADKMAALAGLNIDRLGYRLHYCKGEYFSYAKPSFLKHLIYPVPEQDLKGLGIHAVLDLAGRLKFGPNAEYVEAIDYRVDPNHLQAFFSAINLMFPQVKQDDLSPDQAGIRPKLQGPGEGVRDFVIKEESENCLPGFVNLIGIESPGLTACLAIAEMVKNLL